MIRSHVPWLPPPTHHLVQEVCGAPAIERGYRTRLHPLGEGVDRDQEKSIAVAVLRKRSRGVDTPAEEGCQSLVDPLQLLQRRRGRSLLLKHRAPAHAVAHVLVHTGPPELLSHGAEQLFASAISQVLVRVRQQLCAAYQRGNDDPPLRVMSGGWEEDLQLVFMRTVRLPQLYEPVALIRVLR